jgi:basic amino acid/polyamine antiporter, APA family
VQSTWSCLLVLTGTYEQLTNYVVFADWIFFGLTVITVLTLRRKVPLSERPKDAFRAPGYPVVQVLFSTIAAAVVLSVVRAAPSAAAKGAVLIALGIPVYFWYAARVASAAAQGPRIGKASG